MGDWDDYFSESRGALLLEMIAAGDLAVNERDEFGHTPLMAAVEAKDLASMVRLITLGANPNARGEDGSTCLSLAIHADCGEEVLSTLVASGTDLELESLGFFTPLALATANGNLRIMEYLLRHGANIEARGEMGETPLLEACGRGYVQAVALLLRFGANVSVLDQFGQDAFVHAKHVSQREGAVVSMLNEHLSRPNKTL